MKHAWIAVIGLAACGGAPARTSTVADDVDSVGGGIPPLFSAMFVDGKRFTYKVESKLSFWDDTNPKADQDGNVTDVRTSTMTCTVRGMQNFTSAVAVRVECDLAYEPPIGVYVATPEGIWRLDAFPMDDAAIAKLPPAEMVLSATPTATNDRREDPSGEGGTMIAIEQKDGAWCRTWSSWGGDEAGNSLCFAAGKGLAGGSMWFAGGSTTETTYTLVP